MTNKYILDEDQVPVVCNDPLKWGRWFAEADRHVAKTTIGDVTISTVFLGVDHNYGDGPPILYETMIFGGERNDYQTRASTRGEAIGQHVAAVAIAFGLSK